MKSLKWNKSSFYLIIAILLVITSCKSTSIRKELEDYHTIMPKVEKLLIKNDLEATVKAIYLLKKLKKDSKINKNLYLLEIGYLSWVIRNFEGDYYYFGNIAIKNFEKKYEDLSIPISLKNKKEEPYTPSLYELYLLYTYLFLTSVAMKRYKDELYNLFDRIGKVLYLMRTKYYLCPSVPNRLIEAQNKLEIVLRKSIYGSFPNKNMLIITKEEGLAPEKKSRGKLLKDSYEKKLAFRLIRSLVRNYSSLNTFYTSEIILHLLGNIEDPFPKYVSTRTRTKVFFKLLNKNRPIKPYTIIKINIDRDLKELYECIYYHQKPKLITDITTKIIIPIVTQKTAEIITTKIFDSNLLGKLAGYITGFFTAKKMIEISPPDLRSWRTIPARLTIYIYLINKNIEPILKYSGMELPTLFLSKVEIFPLRAF